MISMSKKLASILLIIVTVIGSLFVYYASNFLFSDVGNMVPGIKDANIITTFPIFMFSLQFILGAIYLARYIRVPQYLKARTKKFLIISASFSFVGLVTSILSGVIVYHGFFKIAPFFGYPFFMALFSAILIATAVYFYIYASKNMKEDAEKKKKSVTFVLFNIANSLMLYFAFERFGAFLTFPFWIQWRTLYLTWPFVLSIVVPMSMLVQTFLYQYDSYKNKPLVGLIYACVNFVLGIGLNIANRLIGYYDSRAISAISPAMSIERLDCSTIITKITFVVLTLVGILTIAHALVHFLRCKKAQSQDSEVKE